jgi:hypothetical protein
MIIRTDGSEDLVLVPQTEHSKLVGQIAANWGNDTFDVPDPFASVVRAATYHDFGWLPYESDPIFEEAMLSTPHYLEVPNSPRQLQAHQACFEWLSKVDPYSGLLASMHRTGLWQRRYGVIDYPKAYLQPAVRTSGLSEPAVAAFVEENEALQKPVRAELGEQQVWHNYRLLQVWDLLGLYFATHNPDELDISPVPLSFGGSEVVLKMRPKSLTEVVFDPFPFRERGCTVSVAVKRISRASFQDTPSFRRAYFRAPLETILFTLS